MTKLSLLTASLLSLTPVANACGGLFCEPARPVVQAGEAIAFGVNGNQVEMHVQIFYEGPAEGFSWVLPMPVTPTDISVGTDFLFTSLFQSTLPQFTLNVNNTLSNTCTPDDFGPVMCPMAMAEMAADGGAIVVQDGTIGPFDFVVLEAADGNPDSIFQWLETNGYDQPDAAAPLLNYYASMDQKFVALKLTKDTEAGEIQPLIIKYVMENADENTPIACVPIKLTAIAANDNMPVQVYVMANARATPLNYMDVALDDTLVDWVGCLNNRACYDDNYRARVRQALEPLGNHGFVTEFAGSTEILKDTISFVDIDMAALEASTTWIEFLNQLADAGVPSIPYVDNLISSFVPNTFDEGPFCADLYMPDQMFNMNSCFERYVEPEGWAFDPVGMVQAFEEKVFQPARDAQAFVDSFSYMTRMYGVLGPDTMDKDPFFTLNPDAPDVSNIHTAEGVPVCVVGEDGPIALDIRLEATGQMIQIPARPACRGWRPTGDPLTIVGSPATTLTSWGFADQDARVLFVLDDGTFAKEDIAEVVATADALVPSQIVQPYSYSGALTSDSTETAAPSANSDTTDTAAPEDTSATISLGRNLPALMIVALLNELAWFLCN